MAATVSLLDRRLVFVTGKGGVGKTTVAASLALLAASEGRRTLVCEVDAKGDLGVAFGAHSLRFEPTEVHPGLFAMAMDTEASLREYLRLNVRIPLMTTLGPLARTFDFVATAAPGVKEILTVGKLAYEVREQHYDFVVVDASATGHVVGQLASPVAMAELVQVGLVRQQTAWMTSILTDPAQTGVVVVSTPEEMPVSESLELVDRLQGETGIDVAAVIANRVLPELFNRAEEAVFDRLSDAPDLGGLRSALGDRADNVLAAAELAMQLRRSRAAHLRVLREGLPSSIPLLFLPELFARASGIRTTRRMAEHLGEELL